MNVSRFIEKVDEKKREILKKSKLSNAELHMFMAGMNSAMEAIEEGGGDCCGWIPVEERLPDSRKEIVLACDRKGVIALAWFEGNKWFRITTFTGDWDYKVVAWMPLPEPYRPDALREAGAEVGQDVAAP